MISSCSGLAHCHNAVKFDAEIKEALSKTPQRNHGTGMMVVSAFPFHESKGTTVGKLFAVQGGGFRRRGAQTPSINVAKPSYIEAIRDLVRPLDRFGRK